MILTALILPLKFAIQFGHLITIDNCALQETEIVAGFPEQILDCHNFKLELETNDIKKRAGFYIKKDVK